MTDAVGRLSYPFFPSPSCCLYISPAAYRLPPAAYLQVRGVRPPDTCTHCCCILLFLSVPRPLAVCFAFVHVVQLLTFRSTTVVWNQPDAWAVSRIAPAASFSLALPFP